ncbi:MAG: glycosyltransferase, partial [Bacteroidales bacterium]|nr:glycosyltransferase [Bacteroidales bacterium]
IIDSERVLSTINPFSYFSAARKIAKFNPDMLIMKYWMPFFGPSLGTVAKKLSKNTKSIAILDNVLPHEKRFFDKAFNSYFLKRIDGFIAMSEQVKGDLLKLKPNAKVILLPHPIYNHFGENIDKQTALEKLGLQENKKTLLFFGFIRDYKGLDNLILAFNKLDKSYQLIIAGETYGSFDKYQNLINENSNKENIKVFNDYIPDNAVTEFFSAADVCVLPYRSATQSGITGISYNFGLPILATNKGGLKEFIEHGKTGHIVSDSSPELIKQGIEDFFSSYNFDDMSKNIAKVKAELSWEYFAKEIIKFSSTI